MLLVFVIFDILKLNSGFFPSFSVERKTLLQDFLPLVEPFTGPLTEVPISGSSTFRLSGDLGRCNVCVCIT